MNTDEKKLIAALIDELRTILGAMIDAPVEAAASALTGRVWRLRIAISATTVVTLAFDEAGASALTAALARQSGTPDDDAIGSALREVCSQVIGGAATRVPAAAGTPEIADPEIIDWPAATAADVIQFTAVPLTAALRVAFLVQIVSGVSTDTSRPASATLSSEPTAEERLDVILDIDLPLVVRFGCTDMPLKALARLGPGSVIDLGRSPDDPVEVLVGNRVIARGEVVVVSGSYGIRIVDVVSPRERIHGLGE
jgi:flagellar motor switch protein FliN/FliY